MTGGAVAASDICFRVAAGVKLVDFEDSLILTFQEFLEDRRLENPATMSSDQALTDSSFLHAKPRPTQT